MTNEELARDLAWRIKGYPNRCAICSFPLAESADKGCVIGNCSYRPRDGSAEDGRVSFNRSQLAEITGIILAALDSRASVAPQATGGLHELAARWRKAAEESKRIFAENQIKMQRGEMITFSTTVGPFVPIQEIFANELEGVLAQSQVPARWACVQCANLNYASDMKCVNCGAAQADPAPAGQSSEK